ncbi:MAG: hypothetical protein ACI4QV_00270, partial [Acutalibacteraceae bacterium]
MSKRTLESLQKQYAREVAPQKGGPGGPGGPGGHGPGKSHMRSSGKPKNTKNTIRRIMNYIGKYKINLAAVVLCMIISTLTSLCGSYMLSPIINRIQLQIAPNSQINLTKLGTIADSLIEKITRIPFINNIISEGKFHAITVYMLSAVILLASIYLIGVITTYIQAKLML